MPKQKPHEILAEALTHAKQVSGEKGVLKHSDLESKYIQVLKKGGWLTPIIKGWYLLNKPEDTGTSTVWYVGFWSFLKAYLEDRLGKDGYCLSAEASVSLHTAEEHIHKQITVITKKNTNQTIDLPFGTSLLLYTDTKNFPQSIQDLSGLSVMPLPLALCRLSPAYFQTKPLNVEIALRSLSSVSEVSRIFLDNGLVTSASRLAGAFEALGDQKAAKQIIDDMDAAGYAVESQNPFERYTSLFTNSTRIRSPYVGRIQALWKKMRLDIIDILPPPPGLVPRENKNFVHIIEERYIQDAYHSLSIEGYEVSEELIEKIQSGNWSPDSNASDLNHKNAMAAKGYYESFIQVLDSIKKILRKDKSASEVFYEDLQDWYRALFSPSVQAGIIKAADLAGYRNAPVYIKNARHVPPRSEAVTDAMEALFSLIKDEEHEGVKAILGHFIFVYIHPYMDGNGRIARFLMNLMLTSGGYDWTIIRTESRNKYMAALDAASSDGDIKPFAKLVAQEMEHWKDQGS
ncbi:MAG: Fic family protein [Bdellovibrionaceae bacterium]|nr:Fic family protein [Pseudobdellovibrionaceae bacterium]